MGLLMILFYIVLFIMALFIYLLPAYIAARRNHKNKSLIFWINLLLAWSGIPWLLIGIWAIVGETSGVEEIKNSKNSKNSTDATDEEVEILETK